MSRTLWGCLAAAAPRDTPCGLDDRIWDRLGDMAEAAGTDRATVLRQLIAWYVGEGELPARPVDSERDEG